MDIRNLKWITPKSVSNKADVTITKIGSKGHEGIAFSFKNDALSKVSLEEYEHRIAISSPQDGYVFFLPDKGGYKITTKDSKTSGYCQLQIQEVFNAFNEAGFIGEFPLKFEEESKMYYININSKRIFK